MGIVKDAFSEVFKKKKKPNKANDLKKVEELERLLAEQRIVLEDKQPLTPPPLLPMETKEEVKELPKFETKEDPKETEEITAPTDLGQILRDLDNRITQVEQFLLRNFR